MLIAELGLYEGLLKKPRVLGAHSISLINLNHGSSRNLIRGALNQNSVNFSCLFCYDYTKNSII